MPARLAARLLSLFGDADDRRITLAVIAPVMGLTAWLAVGPWAAAAVTLGLPTLAVALPRSRPRLVFDAVTGLDQREALERRIARNLATSRRGFLQTGVLALEIDRFKQIEERHDSAGVETVLRVTADRLRRALRDADRAARLDGPVFAVALAPARRLDLESAIQLATRLQRALSEPIGIRDANLYPSVSVGFALTTRLDRPGAADLLRAATLARIEAGRSGPGAIRSYSGAMRDRVSSRGDLASDVTGAMNRGEISAFFQPQISTRTGDVTGFESLARWHHPRRGLIPPAEFLPALRQAGLMDRLGAHMVTEALAALRLWDDAGLAVPRVGVNFSTEELVDPHLVDRIRWELDRFALTAGRLGIEVLETVVAGGAEDRVVRSLADLARLGCALDLDDFGTGHASITNIRRFAIGRIKIDRTFVTRIDADAEQQNMVAAILTMADRLGLDTLAEGVETPEEQAMLAHLGCGHVQGFGIARPMPLKDATRWLADRKVRSATPVPLRRIG